jgi:dephospho-CoA kinase
MLIETGRYKNLAGLIVVHSTVEQRRTRLIARDGILTELADQMILSQTTDEQRRQAATYIIQNDGTLEDLKSQVAALIALISKSLAP